MGSKKARNKSAASRSSATPTSGRGFRPGLLTLPVLAAVVAAFLLLTMGRTEQVQSQEPQPVRPEPLASQGASAPVSQSPASADAPLEAVPPVEAVPPARATPSQAAAALPSPVAQPSLPPLPPLPPGLALAGPAQVVSAVYEFAARHPEVLRYVPCFCGCEQDGHRANEDCFVASRDSEGRVTAWDRHGLT